jgi:hypothetical protein
MMLPAAPAARNAGSVQRRLTLGVCAEHWRRRRVCPRVVPVTDGADVSGVSAKRRVYEWLAPEKTLSEDDHARAVSYLEGQGRFDLAVWVGYRFRSGGTVDHELQLRLRGRRPNRRDLLALFWGVSHEVGLHAYIAIPTRAEMESIRGVGEFVWERTGPAPEYQSAICSPRSNSRRYGSLSGR